MSLIPVDNFSLFPLIPLLYAEIHYRIPGIFSRLWMDEPEIVIDLPHRLEPGQALPLLLLIKDADRYPVKLDRIDVDFYAPGVKADHWTSSFNGCTVKQPFWHQILYPACTRDLTGPIQIDVKVSYRRRAKRRVCHNDNYRGSSHRPFTVLYDSAPLPGRDRCTFGDIHVHTSFTSDQVEFGAPLEATAEMARAMGLGFFAATDHSYDLDDLPQDYLQNDPSLTKWHQMRRRVDQLESDDMVILPGEELSAGNAGGRNVHLLLLNNDRFQHGDGDSAEKWLRNRPTLSITEALEALSSEALAFCAHPEIPPPPAQWLLIRRGKWCKRDLDHPRLNGLQIWNGLADNYFVRGLRQWTRLLMKGRRLSIVAGNDAHGNFGRYRQIRLPFWNLDEARNQLFGAARTGVLARGRLSRETVTRALREGRSLVTDGPFADLQVLNRDGAGARLGETVNSAERIRITALSSPAFGELAKITMFTGRVGGGGENRSRVIEPDGSPYQFDRVQQMPEKPERGYVRLEVLTSLKRRALTNPIYIDTRQTL